MSISERGRGREGDVCVCVCEMGGRQDRGKPVIESESVATNLHLWFRKHSLKHCLHQLHI